MEGESSIYVPQSKRIKWPDGEEKKRCWSWRWEKLRIPGGAGERDPRSMSRKLSRGGSNKAAGELHQEEAAREWTTAHPSKLEREGHSEARRLLLKVPSERGEWGGANRIRHASERRVALARFGDALVGAIPRKEKRRWRGGDVSFRTAIPTEPPLSGETGGIKKIR